jgi:nitrogen PTS system EIIA component
MILTDILSRDRIRFDLPGAGLRTKDAVLRAAADMLARGQASASPDQLFRVLTEREALQSTGIGDGIAIPHGALETVTLHTGAVLVCRDGVDFEAIDGRPVRIVFAVVGPKGATGEHLKVLARVSHLLRDSSFREKLVASQDPKEAFDLIRSAEEGRAE